MHLETLIRQNSYHHCKTFKYKSKLGKGIKIHIGKVHNNHVEDFTYEDIFTKIVQVAVELSYVTCVKKI